MYKINEAKLSETTNNVEAIRDNFGKWVQLYIQTDSKVIVTSIRKNFLNRVANMQILGELSKEHSKSISDKIYAGKKVKARIFDFCPAYVPSQNPDPQVKRTNYPFFNQTHAKI